MRDLASNIKILPALAPAVQSASIDGITVDTLGFESCAFVLNTGAIAGSGDFGAKLQESDASGSGFTDVAADDRVGSFIATAVQNATEKVSYIGHKRYVRLVLTKAGGTSIAASALALLGRAQSRPIS